MSEINLKIAESEPTEPSSTSEKMLRDLEATLSVMKFQLADEGEPDWLKWSVERRMPQLRQKLRAQYAIQEQQEVKRQEYLQKQEQRIVTERHVALAFDKVVKIVQQVEDVTVLHNPELFSHAIKMGLGSVESKSGVGISQDLQPLAEAFRVVAKTIQQLENKVTKPLLFQASKGESNSGLVVNVGVASLPSQAGSLESQLQKLIADLLSTRFDEICTNAAESILSEYLQLTSVAQWQEKFDLPSDFAIWNFGLDNNNQTTWEKLLTATKLKIVIDQQVAAQVNALLEKSSSATEEVTKQTQKVTLINDEENQLKRTISTKVMNGIKTSISKLIQSRSDLSVVTPRVSAMKEIESFPFSKAMLTVVLTPTQRKVFKNVEEDFQGEDFIAELLTLTIHRYHFLSSSEIVLLNRFLLPQVLDIFKQAPFYQTYLKKLTGEYPLVEEDDALMVGKQLSSKDSEFRISLTGEVANFNVDLDPENALSTLWAVLFATLQLNKKVSLSDDTFQSLSQIQTDLEGKLAIFRNLPEISPNLHVS